MRWVECHGLGGTVQLDILRKKPTHRCLSNLGSSARRSPLSLYGKREGGVAGKMGLARATELKIWRNVGRNTGTDGGVPVALAISRQEGAETRH